MVTAAFKKAAFLHAQSPDPSYTPSPKAHAYLS